jgi:hypothetical protein
MNSERILLALLLVVAVLAAIPQIDIPMIAGKSTLGLILVALGLIGGALGNYGNATDRIVIYVASFAIPVFAGSLDAIPVVGSWVHQVLGHVATGIQGMAVSILVLAIYGRVVPR